METRVKRPHSVKVPQFYKMCSMIIREYLEFKGKIPKLTNELWPGDKHRSLYRPVLKHLLVMEPHMMNIKSIVKKVGLVDDKDERSNRILPVLYAVVGDLLFNETNSRLTNQCAPVTTVMGKQEELKQLFSSCEVKFCSPRWVRINTLLASEEEVLEQLKEEGWYLVNEEQYSSYDEYLNAVKELDERQFLKDFHIPGLLAFPPQCAISRNSLYSEKKIVLQDKASCLPGLISGVLPSQQVVDACAAPGNKTSQLAAMMKGKGRLLAVEMDETRFLQLKANMASHGVRRVQLVNKDFTKLGPEDLKGVQTIVLDPSCSNSGVDMFRDEKSSSEGRIRALAGMQFKLLCHALRVEGVQSVVYSTCSVHQEENEGVVIGALNKFQDQFELEDLGASLAQWKHFGETLHAGSMLRTKPEVDFCHGFFVAKFVRKCNQVEAEEETEYVPQETECVSEEMETEQQDSECDHESNGHDFSIKKKKKSKLEHKSELLDDAADTHMDDSPGSEKDETDHSNGVVDVTTESHSTSDTGASKKKHKKNKKREIMDSSNEEVDIATESHSTPDTDVIKKKHKKKNKKREIMDSSNEEVDIATEANSTSDTDASKKKHKKKREILEGDSETSLMDCSVSKKKKKGKSIDIECDENRIVCDVSKKKKKKDRKENEEETDYVSEEVVETRKENSKCDDKTNGTVDDTMIVKKKKKDRKKDKEILDGDLETTSLLDCSVSKKKKKHQNIEVEDDENKIVCDESKKKKKKDRKEKEVETDYVSNEVVDTRQVNLKCNDITNGIDDSIKPKKKKKDRKKDKEIEILDDNLESPSLLDCSVSKKKKRKDIVETDIKSDCNGDSPKKIKSNVEAQVENDANEVSGSSDVSKKKKRKKDSKRETVDDEIIENEISSSSDVSKKKKRKKDSERETVEEATLDNYVCDDAVSKTKKRKKSHQPELLDGDVQMISSNEDNISKKKVVGSPDAPPQTKTQGKESSQGVDHNSWASATFSNDADGKMADKFRKLMGVKGAAPGQRGVTTDPNSLFSSLSKQYDAARMATHSARGTGLGFAQSNKISFGVKGSEPQNKKILFTE